MAVTGPKLAERLRALSGDRVTERRDGIAIPDVRTTIETNDGALIYLDYSGTSDRGEMAMNNPCKVDGRLEVRGCTFRRASIMRDYAQAAEGLGYSYLLAPDHVLGANPSADRGGFSSSAAASAATFNADYQRVGTIRNAYHDPFVLFGVHAAEPGAPA